MKVDKKEVKLKKIRKIFFVGVGGVGISALAKLALDKEYEIAAVNDVESKETLDELREKNVPIFIGNNTDEFENFDLIIYSVAWEQRAPELMKKIFNSKIPVINYFEGLSLFTSNFPTIGVAGTHGKTTTTAMIKKTLEDSPFDPNTIVGSILSQNGSNYLKGRSDWFLVESCEYKRHFLHLNPKIAVITNIEEDHLDYYKNLDDILDAFLEFINKAEIVILNKKEKNIQKILGKIKVKIIDYSDFLEDARELDLKVFGEHNIMNAAVVLALVKHLNLDLNQLKNNLENFSGTWRRFEYMSENKNKTKIYADYAHHPTEIKTVIDGVRDRFEKIFVIFEPHTFSRTQLLADEFAQSFNLANGVFITEIYPAREEPILGIDSNFLVEKIKKNSQRVKALNLEEALKEIEEKSDEKDIILVLGAGDIYFDLKNILV